MHNKKQSRRFSLPFIVGITIAILSMGGGAAWWAIYSLERDNQSTTNNPPIAEQPLPSAVTEQKQIKVWWLNPKENKIELVSKTMTFQKSVQPNQVIKTALENLLSGPEDTKYTTTIPEGTKLLNVNLDKEGIYINLSQQFTTGGGSASMTGRLAQVIYTATSADPESQVWISVEGKPLNHLGEEGLIINQPMTRGDFEANFTL